MKPLVNPLVLLGMRSTIKIANAIQRYSLLSPKMIYL